MIRVVQQRNLRKLVQYKKAEVMDKIKKVYPKAYDVPTEFLKDPRSKILIGSSRKGVNLATLPHVSSPVSVWPGILSSDPEFCRTRLTIADEATDSHPGRVDEAGFTLQGHPNRDFTALATVAGMKPSMSNCPPPDRTEMLAEAGISTQFVSPLHREIYTVLHKQMFYYRAKGASAKFAVTSNLFFPTYIGGEGSQAEKQAVFHYVGENLEKILKLVKSGNLYTLLKDHDIVFAAHIVQRLQSEGLVGEKPNRVGKPRFVSTREYAQTGKGDRRKEVSKMYLTQDVLGLKECPSARHRVAYAMNGNLNALVTMLQAGCREYYFEEFAATWHHTGPRQLYDAVKTAVKVVGLDMSNMDQWIPPHILDLHASLQGEYYGPEMGKLFTLLNGAAYFSPQASMGDTPFWIGDFRTESGLNNDIGLASGRADNPDLGKFYCTGVYIIALLTVCPDIISFAGSMEQSIREFLRGNHPKVFLLDMGDDAVVGFKIGAEKEAHQFETDLKAKADQGSSISPYAQLAPEHGVAFLGSLVVKDEAGTIVMPHPNPVTWMVNRHCPEYGIDSPSRKYWAAGLMAAKEHYGAAGSIISDLQALERDIWKRYMPDHPTPEQFIEMYAQSQPIPTGAGSFADAEVLMDPTKIYYKYTLADLTPSVAQLFIRTIDGDRIDNYFRGIVPQSSYM